MKRAGPGLADTNRARPGAFASLLDQILVDPEALDALVFAYRALRGERERGELAKAVLQDAANPVPALSAMLAVEPTPALQRRLATWIGERAAVEREARLEGTEADGRARLTQRLPGLESESLYVVWKDSDIERLAIEPGTQKTFEAPAAVSDLDETAERLAPLLWRYIRTGAVLPAGIERFAPFFAPSPPEAPDRR